MMRNEIGEGFRIALQALALNKMRSSLTMMGIIIGITTVTLMATVINGIDREFDGFVSSLSADVLYVERLPRMYEPGFKWWEYANRPIVRAELADVIEHRARYAETAAPVVQTARLVRYRDKTLRSVAAFGTDARYARVHNVDLDAGRFFSEIDDHAARRVCVLGNEIAGELFPNEDPLGKKIRIGQGRFTVLGVLSRRAGSEGAEVYIPYSAFKNTFGVRNRSVSVQVKAASMAVLDDAEEEVVGLVRTARRLDAMAENNFEVTQQRALQQQMAPVKFAIYGVGLFLTALSLLAGGIGVMNIMFVSVKERTHEIGIRKAVGARPRAILIQFLIEAMTLCLAGGGVGLLLTLLFAQLIKMVMPALLPVGTMVLALVLCMAVGLAAGFAPAWAAAQAEPVKALRYE